MLYHNFVIYMNLNDYNDEIFNKICYTNYKLVLIVDDVKNIKIKTNNFIELCVFHKSQSYTILNHCRKIQPNSIILVTDFLTSDMLLKLNNEFLRYKRDFITNNKIDEQHYKIPFYWTCKAYILHEIERQIKDEQQHNLELSLNALDIVNFNQYVLKLCEDYNDFDIETVNMINRIKCGTFIKKTHIVMSTYERNNYLHDVLSALEKQTKKLIHLHILDNNTDETKQKELDDILLVHDNVETTLYRFNFNNHCISRIYLIKNLLKYTYMDYVIIFDDDQVHHENWIERLLNECRPLSTLSWYGKIFEKCDYWNKDSNTNKILTYSDIEFMKKKDVKQFKYFGPGGCIIDTSIFLFNEIFDFIKYSKEIFKIDDIWLSFLFEKYLNIPLNRMFYHPLRCSDRNDNNKTWTNIKENKNELMKLFHNQYNWNISTPSRKFNTFNNTFSFP